MRNRQNIPYICNYLIRGSCKLIQLIQLIQRNIFSERELLHVFWSYFLPQCDSPTFDTNHLSLDCKLIQRKW